LKAQVSGQQHERILGYIDIDRKEGAEVVIDGEKERISDELDYGYDVQPTILLVENSMRVFQEEISGPVISVTTFKTEEEALAIANNS
jgi:aldehyde dehydrogenase